MTTKMWAYRVMKALLIFICVIFFFVLMVQIGKKFKDSQWKAVATLEETYEELAYPQLTICPSKPYKEGAGNELLAYFWHANTYVESEMIVDTTGSTQELVRSWNKGRCFAIDFSQSSNASVTLNKGLDYNIYLAPANANFWLNFDKTPRNVFAIHLKTSDFDSQAMIKMTKEIYTDLENCQTDLNEGYDACSKSKITEKFNTDLTCTTPTLELLELSLNICFDANEVHEVNAKVDTIVNADHGCLKQCTWEKYSGYTEYIKDTTTSDISGEELEIKLEFDGSGKVKHYKEFYIYDGIDMVMAVGGILAFFLGFSLLSVLLDCVDVISRACGHHDSDAKLSSFKRTFRQ